MKVVSLNLDNATATAVAGDFGLQWRPSERPFRLGFSLRNVGTSLTFDLVKEDLPLLGRVGGELLLWSGRMRLHADAEMARGEDARFMGGGEFVVFEHLTLRAGYDGRIDAGSDLTAGVGFQSGDFTLDYAYVPFGDIGDNHRVGMTIRF